MGFVDPIRLLPPHLQRYAERARVAGPFIPPVPKVPADFNGLPDASCGIGRDRARTIASIVSTVCRVAGISTTAMMGERRFPAYVRARHVAMWLADRETGLSHPRIARACGNCDHTTVFRAVRRLNFVIKHHGLDMPADIEVAAGLLLGCDWPFTARHQ